MGRTERIDVRRKIPSPGGVIGFAALLIALGGYALAAPPGDSPNQEVILETTTAGPVETVDDEAVEVPLTSFTQKAGEAVTISVEADFDFQGDPDQTACEVGTEFVTAESGEGGAVIELGSSTRRGPIPATDSVTLPAPAADTVRNLVAPVNELAPVPEEVDDVFSGLECIDDFGSPDPNDWAPSDDHWTVSFRVTIIRLR